MTKHSLSRITLFIRISWSCRFKLLFFVIFFLISSYYPCLLSRSVCIRMLYMSLSALLFSYFSYLSEIVFLLVHDWLYHQPSLFPVAFHRRRMIYLPRRASSFEMLVHFNFLRALLLSIFTRFIRITFYLQIYSISLLTFFKMSVLQFTFFWIIIFFYYSVILRRVTFRVTFSNLILMNLLILSIYLISPFLSVLRVTVSFLFFHSSPDFTWHQQHQDFTFTLLSSTRAPLCFTNPFFSFSFPVDDFTCLSLTNMYSLLLVFTSRTFYASFSPLLMSVWWISISASRPEIVIHPLDGCVFDVNILM